MNNDFPWRLTVMISLARGPWQASHAELIIEGIPLSGRNGK